jgi:hypothetical protein
MSRSEADQILFGQRYGVRRRKTSCHPPFLLVGDEQDGRSGGVATTGGVGPVVRWEVSRRRRQLFRSPESGELTGRREENNGGERGCEDFVMVEVAHHDLHDWQLPYRELTDGCHGLTRTG